MSTHDADWQGEQGRLHSLRSLQILNTPREQAFDELVELASEICQTPIAAFSLVDEDRQWFKSVVGLDASGTPRCDAFCSCTIMASAPLVVPDASLDQSFSSNPLVTGAPYIRFYAGVPVRSPRGQRIGALCVIDRKPRNLTAQQLRHLSILGRQIEQLLELRQRKLLQR